MPGNSQFELMLVFGAQVFASRGMMIASGVNGALIVGVVDWMFFGRMFGRSRKQSCAHLISEGTACISMGGTQVCVMRL